MSLVDDFLKQAVLQQSTKPSNKFSKNKETGFIVHNKPGFTKISEEQAMSIPAVSAAVNLISSSVAKLPIELKKIDSDGNIEKVEDDYRLFLLNDEPNESQYASTLKKRMTIDYLFYGASFLYTERKNRSNKIKSIHRLPVEKVNIERKKKDGYIDSYSIYLDGERKNMFKTIDIITMLKDTEDGFEPRGILDTGYKTLSNSLSEIEYSSSILKNGSLPLAVLKAANRLSDDVIKRIKRDWSNSYTGESNAGKTVLLEEGLEYETISLNPNELELTESKKGSLADIARLFNIPESMINSSANKYNSNEENNILFLQYTLEPILINMQKALNKTLLLESEKASKYYFEFDTSEIMTITEKERAEIAQILSNTSSVTQNEIRQLLGKPKLEKDYMFLSQGKVFYNTETGKAFNPNLGVQFDPDNPDETIKKQVGQNSLNQNNNLQDDDLIDKDALSDKEGEDIEE